MNIGIRFFNLCFLLFCCSVDNFVDSFFVVLFELVWCGNCLLMLKNIILYEYFVYVNEFMNKVILKIMIFDNF